MRSIQLLTIAFWIAGVVVVGVLVHLVDVQQAIRAAKTIGWSFVPVLMIRPVLLFVDGQSWRCLLEPNVRPSLRAAAFQRWVGESVGTMLPFAAIGGELARVRVILLAGISGAVAFASIIMDGVVAVLSQFLFLCLGIVFFSQPMSGGESLNGSVLTGGVVLFVAAATIWVTVRSRAIGRIAKLLKTDLAGERVGWLADAMSSVDQQIAGIIANRRTVSLAVLWRLLGWLLGTTEIWLILWLLGHPVSIVEALVLDAVTSAVRTAFFFVPGGLVVQEGAILIVGAALGADADAILVAAVIKRTREIFFSIPGLMAWNFIEARAIQHGGRGA